MSQLAISSEPIRVASPPAATIEAQERAHDPALVSPEPPADVQGTGALS